MYASYNQLLAKRTKVHTDQIMDYEDPSLAKEEKTRRIEYNYGLCMKMLKSEVVLFAEMITSFGPFIYLPSDQRVSGINDGCEKIQYKTVQLIKKLVQGQH